ncbi:Uncharacterised protein [Actinomyces bovis]|uniref:DUF2029 domain-containing protein n=1 Tax=Actinomyces bovis TaxID=1658 RepID=A0ABY1VN86_9ACTO|nr:DUF6541 family protein [Actinomyces bovis]SPT53288.1 Uncharacterised protein [Actinomyces bovis]VEG52590.1 Uncharacterised protein [Actinomyces israelii]
MSANRLWPTEAISALGPLFSRAILAPLAGVMLLAAVLGKGAAAEGSWFTATPIFMAAVLGLLVPGWSVAQAWGLRGITAVGAAPALTGALVAVGSLVAPSWGWSWNRAQLLPGPFGWCWGLLVLLGIASQLLPGRGDREIAQTVSLTSLGRWLLGGALALAGVLTAIPVLLATPAPESPMQASDAVYHLSVTAFVRVTGDASPFGASAPLYDGAHFYYPSLWHAIASLLPGSVVAGGNVLVLVLAAVIWPLSMAALLREVLARREASGQSQAADDGYWLALGVGLSGSVVSVLLLLTSVWPYSLSICMLPGCLALLVRACLPGALGLRGRSRAVLVAGIACIGVVGAHGASVFNLAVLGGPLVLTALVGPIRSWWHAGGLGRLLLSAAGVLGLGLVAAGAWAMRDTLASVIGYERPRGNIPETLYAVVADHPLLATFTPYIPGNALVFLLALAAALGAWKRSHTVRTWAISTALGLTLLLLSAGPRWPLRALAGPWYTQRARIMVLVTIGLLVLAPLGGRELARRWQGAPGWRSTLTSPAWRLPAALLAVSLVVAPAWRWGLRTEIMAAVHDPQQISFGTMLSDEELAMIRRAPSKLPADAVVVGNPSNGSAYLWSVAGVRVVYATRLVPWPADLAWLGDHLHELGSNPKVCEVLRQRGVTYYYSDDAPADGATGGGRQALWGPHLEEVPREHLELLDSADSGGGTAALWRITACG